MAGVTEVARYDNVLDAHRVLAILADAEIEAEVHDGYAGAALSHVGAVGVRVVVADEDAARAQAVLAADAARRRASAADEREAGAELDAGREARAAAEDDVARSGRRTRGILIVLLLLLGLVGGLLALFTTP